MKEFFIFYWVISIELFIIIGLLTVFSHYYQKYKKRYLINKLDVPAPLISKKRYVYIILLTCLSFIGLYVFKSYSIPDYGLIKIVLLVCTIINFLKLYNPQINFRKEKLWLLKLVVVGE